MTAVVAAVSSDRRLTPNHVILALAKKSSVETERERIIDRQRSQLLRDTYYNEIQSDREHEDYSSSTPLLLTGAPRTYTRGL